MFRLVRAFFLATLLATIVQTATSTVHAQNQTDNGTINLSSVVAGPAPSTAPTIDNPVQNSTFRDKNITVGGDCISGLVVKIFRNNIFAGSALCDSSGTYSFGIDLVSDRNDLIARQYDLANQSSPDSEIVTVFFVPLTTPDLPSQPSQPSAPSTPAAPNQSPAPPTDQPPLIANFQLVIDYDYTFQGVFTNKPFNLPIGFSGGSAPYALSIDWGDGESSLFSRGDTTRFTSEHIYTSTGFKTVVIKVSDGNGEEAQLQFVIVVNGQTSAPVTRQLFGSEVLIEQWPIIVVPSIIGGIIIGGVAAAGITSYIMRRRLRRP